MTAQVSLVMTVLNEELTLTQFFESLRKQTVQPHQVVVVDGGSSDRTVEVVNHARTRSPMLRIQLISAPGVGISEGRNLGVHAAQCDLIAVTDAGVELQVDWLERLIQALEPDVQWVGGYYRPQADTRLQATIVYAITPPIREIRSATFLPSSRSLLFRKSAWQAVGGYPEWLDYCEDLIFDLKLATAFPGCGKFAPDAVARWEGRSTLGAFWKQYFRYARGDGKSGLWWRRHALRYLAYSFWFAAILNKGPIRIAGLMTWLYYQSKFVRRSTFHSKNETVRSWLILTPAIVTVGDVAKMTGYPAGLFWRSRHRPDKRLIVPDLDR